ncbi:hypothetical protein [Fuerstiella marisgermanici]|uniref:Uncharacterized protein n=1 Tax=Fuerstiella marisgermanici TaxID=1891926 RepID=A0A1P8WQJ8_9PLAN|nr:hypothetical protein [Fuerstiella marisgermanici]APZ96331.1 hypothetical protein Fuma_05999 [Fuerstiella marisgermanici]
MNHENPSKALHYSAQDAARLWVSAVDGLPISYHPRKTSGNRIRHTFQLLVFGLLLACLFPTQLAAQGTEPELKVVEVIWGFDGRVQPGQFNPLSILLDNQTSEPIDATATLQQIQGVLNPTGGQYAQPVFIASTARRWVQFYPYVGDTRDNDWRLEFDGRKTADIKQARAAVKVMSDKTDPPPQVVILDKANRFTTAPSAVKHMPENIFPPYATVTFGLHTVFLDHEPDWEVPRQEAFLSWLYQGGRLHLLHDGRGEFPQFSGSLVDLNQPLDRYSIGSGLVVRHAVQRNEVSEAMVNRIVTVDALKDPDKKLEAELKRRAEQMGYGMTPQSQIEPSSIDDTFFRRMRELTLPEHAWWLIFLLALCYIGLIFPGCFILSKRKDIHFLTTYGAIVGLAVVFSMLFLFIGRRGYGETTNLQTLAVARAEGDTHWNVFQWSALFVTSGDDYTASTDDQQTVLSTADTMDRSDVAAVAGNNGQILMRIPPFSSQTFVSRRRIAGADWKLKITDVDATPSGLVKLTISFGDAFPVAEDNRYLVLSGRRLYELKYNAEDKLLKLFGQKQDLAQFTQPVQDFSYATPWRTQQAVDERSERQKFYEDAMKSLMQRSLLDDLVDQPGRFELPPDRLRLFVYADAPDSFAMDVDAEVKATGRVLFVKDLFLQDVSPTAP